MTLDELKQSTIALINSHVNILLSHLTDHYPSAEPLSWP